MRWSRVEVEVVLLDVLAVVALTIGEPKEAFLDDRISSIPKCEREAQSLLLIREASQAVLAPMVGARTRLILAEVAPCVTIVAIILAHLSPTGVQTDKDPTSSTAPSAPEPPPVSSVPLSHSVAACGGSLRCIYDRRKHPLLLV